MADYRTHTNYVRGLRTNNPLDIKPVGFTYQGQIGTDNIGQAIFSDTVFGLRAAALDLWVNYYLDGNKTISDIINKFAPASDGNDTAAYINAVSAATGIAPNDDLKLNGTTLFNMLRAMMVQEIGQSNAAMINDDDIKAGILAAGKSELTFGAVGGGVLLILIAVLFVLYTNSKDR